MAAIKTTFGEGGANLSPRGQGQPSLVTALRDIADDIAGIRATEITSADATDLAEVITLANEMKAALNALYAYTIKTTKA